jgi:hypothetical protein
MDYTILSEELANDPLGRGYAGMTDQEAADSLATTNRPRNKSSITGDETFGATDSAEFGALGDLKKQLWMSFCGRDSIDPFGTANVAFVQWVFGAGSSTIDNLNTIRVESVARAAELGIPEPTATQVSQARA